MKKTEDFKTGEKNAREEKRPRAKGAKEVSLKHGFNSR